MWEIKTYNKNGKEVSLQKGFTTKDDAESFVLKEYKDRENVFIVEKKGKSDTIVDLSDKIGQWIWMYSPKKKEMFPYGVLRKSSSMFAKIQTNEGDTEPVKMVELRNATIQRWLETGKSELRTDGHFVIIKDYV